MYKPIITDLSFFYYINRCGNILPVILSCCESIWLHRRNHIALRDESVNSSFLNTNSVWKGSVIRNTDASSRLITDVNSIMIRARDTPLAIHSSRLIFWQYQHQTVLKLVAVHKVFVLFLQQWQHNRSDSGLLYILTSHPLVVYQYNLILCQ